MTDIATEQAALGRARQLGGAPGSSAMAQGGLALDGITSELVIEPAVVLHQGVTLGFGMWLDPATGLHVPVDRFHRTVSTTSPAPDPNNDAQWGPWQKVMLDADREGHRVMGAELITLPTQPIQVGSKLFYGPPALVLDTNTTCFSVVSTQTHIVLFRRSAKGTLYVSRFLVLQSGGARTLGETAN